MFPVMRMIRAAVLRRPAQAALWIEGREAVDYTSLRAAAESTADLLRAAGVGPGCRIALELEKSPEYVAAVLGCWEVGAAFCPVPPSLPPVRRREILERLQPVAIVSAAPAEPWTESVVRIAAAAPVRRPWCEQDFRSIPAPIEGRGLDARPMDAEDASHEESTAYIIFTSGSTGRPKGVEVSHRGLPALLRSQIEAFELEPQSRCLFQTSILFDAHLSDLCTTLAAGGTLCLERPERFEDPSGLLRLLHERRITHWDLPPSLLPALSVETENLPDSLACLIFGGEPADCGAVRRLASRIRMVNVYGPTEATICTSLCVCPPDDWRKPLLGSPLPEVRYQVRDAAGRPARVGTPGELWISGPCLARGYLEEPELTRKKFPTVDGVRGYRTGDFVLEIAPGAWEFMGRLDRQFKLRGRLVQPEEVESALLAVVGVRAAAAFPVRTPRGRRTRLAAVVEVDPREPKTASSIRASLAAKLPCWMVPSWIETRERMPRTASGKIDYGSLERSAGLRRPASSVMDSTIDDTPCGRSMPRDDEVVESLGRKTLRDAWRSVLELDEAGLDDDFADLGGDSVDAFHIAALAAAAGVVVAPAEILRHRTLRALLQNRRPRVDAAGGVPPSDAASASRWNDDLATAYFQNGPAASAVESSQRDEAKPDYVVLTGATGLLGRNVLRELLRTSTARIVCLVRAVDDLQAASRIERLAAGWSEVERREVRGRVNSFAADVAAAHWGLAADVWKEVVAPASDLFHLAADLSLARDFPALLAANVRSLLPALAAARDDSGLRLHFASTLAVFASSEGRRGRHAESPVDERCGTVYGGYAQSKWAAEKLLLDFEERFGRSQVRIHRCSLIEDDASVDPHGCDQHTRTVAGLLRLGRLPPMPAEAAVNVVSASAAARALVGLRKAPPGVYHVAAPENLSFESWLARQPAELRTLPKVSAEAFRRHGEDALRRAAGDARAGEELATAFFGFARGWADSTDDWARLAPWDFFLSTGATFEIARTAQRLCAAGVAWEAADSNSRAKERLE